MRSIKVLSTAAMVFVLSIIAVIAQQQQPAGTQGRQDQTQDQMKQQQGKMQQGMQQGMQGMHGTMGNLVGIEVYGQNNAELGSVQDVRSHQDQVYLMIQGSDNQVHPVPVSVINRLLANLSENDFNRSPGFSMNQIMTDSTTWIGRTDEYFERFEVDRPVGQMMPGGIPGGQQPSGGQQTR